MKTKKEFGIFDIMYSHFIVIYSFFSGFQKYGVTLRGALDTLGVIANKHVFKIKDMDDFIIKHHDFLVEYEIHDELRSIIGSSDEIDRDITNIKEMGRLMLMIEGLPDDSSFGRNMVDEYVIFMASARGCLINMRKYLQETDPIKKDEIAQRILIDLKFADNMHNDVQESFAKEMSEIKAVPEMEEGRRT